MNKRDRHVNELFLHVQNIERPGKNFDIPPTGISEHLVTAENIPERQIAHSFDRVR